MTDRTVVLITGASRGKLMAPALTEHLFTTGDFAGIGRCLLSTYLLRANHTVVAGLRDPTSPSTQELQSLPCGRGSQVILVKIDSASKTHAKEAMDILTSRHKVTKIDVVIANAGISQYFGKALVTPAKEMLDHFTINTVAPLLLFQATAALLKAASTPKFVVLSSGAGSLSQVDKLPVENTAYGASKAALNFVTRRIHYENPGLIAFPINPGWLQTELGNHAAKGAGMSAAPVPIQDGVTGLIEQIDKATREETSGRFMAFDGSQMPW